MGCVRRLGAVWLAACLFASFGASAAEGKGRVSGEDVVRILQDEGYRAKLGTDGDGDPKIDTSMSGLDVTVWFYDCEAKRCGSLQFLVALDLKNGWTLEAANKFSNDYRYARLYLDEEKDPYMAFDFEVLNADPGPHIASQVDIFESLLDALAKDTGFDK